MAELAVISPSDAHSYETLTISSTALPCTASKLLATTDEIFVTIETDAIRMLFDGSTPTAAVGHKFAAGTSFELKGRPNINNLLMIRVTTDATVTITYKRGL